jgi:hypothetical protein
VVKGEKFGFLYRSFQGFWWGKLAVLLRERLNWVFCLFGEVNCLLDPPAIRNYYNKFGQFVGR